MSNKISKVEIIGNGLECPKCKLLMERRRHRFLSDKIKKMTYYYEEWDFCKNCKHVQHYEKYKKFNNHTESQYAQHLEEMSSLFKNI